MEIKKFMKTIITGIMSVIVLMSLVACGKDENTSELNKIESTTKESETDTENETKEPLVLTEEYAAELFAENMFITEGYDENITMRKLYVNGKYITTFSEYFDSYRNFNGDVCYFQVGEKVYVLVGEEIKEIEGNMKLMKTAKNSQYGLVCDEAGVLWRYDGENLEKITDKAVDSVAISGDGQTFAYYYEGNSYIGTKPGEEIMVENVEITCISEDGRCLYAVDSNEETSDLYLVNSVGEKKLLAENLDNYSEMYMFNKSASEMVYFTSEGTYIVVDGGEPIKMTDKTYLYKYIAGTSVEPYHLIDSFAGTVWAMLGESEKSVCGVVSDDYVIKVIDKEFEYDWFTISEDESKVLIVTPEDELWVANVEDDINLHKISDDIIDFCMTLDGSIYYEKNNSDGEKINEIHYVDDEFNDIIVAECEYNENKYYSFVEFNGCCFHGMVEGKSLRIDKTEVTKLPDDADFYDFDYYKYCDLSFYTEDDNLYFKYGDEIFLIDTGVATWGDVFIGYHQSM